MINGRIGTYVSVVYAFCTLFGHTRVICSFIYSCWTHEGSLVCMSRHVDG